MILREKAPSNGRKYSRIEQVNFAEDKCFKGCLSQILLDTFLNTFDSHEAPVLVNSMNMCVRVGGPSNQLFITGS